MDDFAIIIFSRYYTLSVLTVCSLCIFGERCVHGSLSRATVLVLLVYHAEAFLPTRNLQSSVVVRGSFHLFRVLVLSDPYLVFRISRVLFISSMDYISALYLLSFRSWSAIATVWLRTYPKFRYTCMRKFQYKHDMYYMYMF